MPKGVFTTHVAEGPVFTLGLDVPGDESTPPEPIWSGFNEDLVGIVCQDRADFLMLLSLQHQEILKEARAVDCFPSLDQLAEERTVSASVADQLRSPHHLHGVWDLQEGRRLSGEPEPVQLAVMVRVLGALEDNEPVSALHTQGTRVQVAQWCSRS